VFHSPRFDVWVVTRYADLCAVVRDPTRFSSAGSLEATAQLPAEVQAVLRTGHLEFLSLVQSDPPDHTRIRNVFNKALSSQRVAAM
jgi:cytochrome P450